MNKALKIYGRVWLAVGIITLIFIGVRQTILPSHHTLASNPDKIEQIVNVELPDILNTESQDNLSRSSSCWDYFEYNSRFNESLAESSIAKLDALCISNSKHWSKDSLRGYYKYSDDGELYCVDCYIYNDHALVSYMVDESEGLFIFLAFMHAYMVLIVWGIALVIKQLTNK